MQTQAYNMCSTGDTFNLTQTYIVLRLQQVHMVIYECQRRLTRSNQELAVLLPAFYEYALSHFFSGFMLNDQVMLNFFKER